MNRRDNAGQTAVADEIPGELSDLLSDLENDGGVQLSLETPVMRQPRYSQPVAGEKPAGAEIPSVRIREGRAVSSPAVVYRDSSDVRTILNLTSAMMVLALLLVASGVGNIYQYLRRPDRIVVDGGSGRVLSINNRNYGREDGIEFGPDRLTAQDKIYITREFVKSVYQVDPATRPRDVERALTMMVPDSAVKFSRWMKEKGVLDQQKAESWQTIWNPMDVSVDKNDPYTVNVIGKQEITKVVNGITVTDARQLRLTIKLVADNKGRADRNLRSGFLVASLDYQELNEPVSKDSGQEKGAVTSTASRSTDITPVSALQNQ
jgi:hypothetical protein